MSKAAVSADHDAYGQEIWHCHRGTTTYEINERDDGFLDVGSALPYFEEFEKWPAAEREAIGRAKARRLLAAMDGITARDDAILASVMDPYQTRDPAHLAYQKRNRDRGRMSGQIRGGAEVCSGPEEGRAERTVEARRGRRCLPWRG